MHAEPETESRFSEPTVAVAFGGGGARGIAHIHVIETLDSMGIKPVAIAGSSIGAIMGAAMASGMTGEEIRAHTLDTIGKPASATQPDVEGGETPRRQVTPWRVVSRLGQFNVERILEGVFARTASRAASRTS
jgi:NTE family protein